MTKRLNKFTIYKKYYEDLWGFLHLKRKRTNLIKLLFWNKVGRFTWKNLKFLNINQISWRRKNFFFKTLRSKKIHLNLKFRRYFSNLTTLQLKRIYKKSEFLEISYKKSIATIIETRVDSILIRTNLFLSIKTIRQWINHGFIFVNLKPIYSSNLNLKIGDVLSFSKKRRLFLIKFFKYRYFNHLNFNFKNKISFREKPRKKFLKKNYFYANQKAIPLFFPPYLELNYKLLFFFLWRYPTWNEIPFLTSFNSDFIFNKNY